MIATLLRRGRPNRPSSPLPFARHLAVSTRLGAAALAGLAFAAAPAVAQDAALQSGDTVVSRFSGHAGEQLDPGGIVAEVLELGARQQGAGSPNILATLTAEEIGQIFAVEIAGRDAPSIYLAASGMYGLYREGDGWAPGMWGPEAGPGTIWKLPPGGDPERFVDVSTEDVANQGAGLGDLAYDETHQQLFVSDLSTGMIHAVDLATGAVAHSFDHGVDGRSYFLDAATAEYLVLDVVPHDPRNRPQFDECRNAAGEVVPAQAEPACWGITDHRRRVWGLGVAAESEGGPVRLYYAVWGGAALGSEDWDPAVDEGRTTLWSVRLAENGGFDLTDVRRELVLPTMRGETEGAAAGETNPVTDIAFAADGSMVTAERAVPQAGGNGEAARITGPGGARALVLRRDGQGIWSVAGRYAAGAPVPVADALLAGASVAGGVEVDTGGSVWLTADPLCTAEAPCPGIAADGSVAGLAALAVEGVTGLVPGEPAAAVPDAVPLFEDVPPGTLGQVAVFGAPVRLMVEAPAPAPETAPETQAAEAPPQEPVAPQEPPAPAAPEPDVGATPLPDPVPLPEPQQQVADTEPVRLQANLAAVARGVDGCKPGGECVFEIGVSNEGPGDFRGPLLLTQTVGGSASLVSSDGADGWSCEALSGAILCQRDAVVLAAGEATRTNVRLRPAQGYGQASLQSCARLTWLGQQGRDRIRAVQAELDRQDFNAGGADGVMGPNTEAALERAAVAFGLPADGAITGRLVTAMFGEGSLLVGDAAAGDDEACATVAIELPPRPAHDPALSTFHQSRASRVHDSGTTGAVSRHGSEVSAFHQTFESSVHVRATSEPELVHRDDFSRAERRQRRGFHDGTQSRFRSDAPSRDAPRVYRGRPGHGTTMSQFHQNFTSEAHDGRTSQPVPLHDPAVTQFHYRAPSAEHNTATTGGRRLLDRDGPRQMQLQHDRTTTGVVAVPIR